MEPGSHWWEGSAITTAPSLLSRLLLLVMFSIQLWTPFQSCWLLPIILREFIVILLLVSGQKWREFKIRARRNSWAVEHRNQFPVPPAESDEEDEDTSWVDHTTYNMKGVRCGMMRKFVSFGCCCQCYIISTWCAVEICAKGAIFVTLKNIIRSWFQSEEEHRLCQRKVTVNSRTTPTPWRECLGARSKWTQMLCNFAYEQSGSSDWSLFTWVERDTESELSIRLELIHLGGEGHWEWIVHQTGAYLPGWRGTLRLSAHDPWKRGYLK